MASGAGGVVHIVFYATMGRGDMVSDGLTEMLAPASMRYGATKYSVQRSNDDRFNIKTLFWFASKDDWYRFWEGEEAIEFRARYSGKFQIPLTYTWHDELGSSADVPGLADVSADVEVVS
jgi:hypothetical protein